MFKTPILALSLAAGLAAFAAAPASAATCGTGMMAVGYDLVQDFTVLIGECSAGGGALGNDTPTNVNNLAPGGINTWVLGDKSDDGDGDQLVTFDDPVPASGQTTWAVLNPSNYPFLLVTLKQGNSYAAYVLDTTIALMGSWLTVGPGNSENGLSHASVFYSGDPAPIPVPAAGLLLASALGGIFVLRRRQRA
jgi:hypothetical protein